MKFFKLSGIRLRHKFLHNNGLLISVSITLFLAGALSYTLYQSFQLKSEAQNLSNSLAFFEQKFASSSAQLNLIKDQDQFKKNEALQKEIININNTYTQSVSVYEDILQAKESGIKTNKFEVDFAKSISLLSQKNYASASAVLVSIKDGLHAEKQKSSTSFNIPNTVITENKPPSSGYRRQNVHTDSGNFMVDIISADLKNTRVIVDTASESDCTNNCPTLPLIDYVNKNGAFAGINGTFFCPETYPTCAGKTNSFDTLLMNKNKKYFNSDNNIYSVIPAIIFSGTSARVVTQSLQWGRDTGVDAVIANHPLLLLGGNSAFSGSSEEKINSKGARCFIGISGSTVYIGVVYNATTGDEVNVLKTLGLQDAIGLDQGGSTALWYGSYKAGPGRNIPNAILLVKR